MIKIPTIPRPKEGCFVFVTQRICSEKLQPSIKLNTPYRFVQETQTESGIRSVVIQPLKNPKNSTINEKRFKWSYTSEAQLKAYYKTVGEEAKTKKSAQTAQVRNVLKKEIAKNVRKTISDEKIGAVILANLICEALIIEYTESCKRQAVINRIEVLKKLSRSVTFVIDEYQRQNRALIEEKSQENILHRAMAKFKEECGRTLFQLEIGINNELLKLAPDHPYISLVSRALCGRAIRTVLADYNKQAKRLFQGVIPGEILRHFQESQTVEKLDAILDAFASGCRDYNPNTKHTVLCRNILLANLKSIEIRIH